MSSKGFVVTPRDESERGESLREYTRVERGWVKDKEVIIRDESTITTISSHHGRLDC